jgi:hypothetical protein
MFRLRETLQILLCITVKDILNCLPKISMLLLQRLYYPLKQILLFEEGQQLPYVLKKSLLMWSTGIDTTNSLLELVPKVLNEVGMHGGGLAEV